MEEHEKNPLISLDIAITIINNKRIKILVLCLATECYVVSVGYTSKFSS